MAIEIEVVDIEDRPRRNIPSFAAWADYDNKNIEISPAEFKLIDEWKQSGFVSQAEIDQCLSDNKMTINEFEHLQRMTTAAWTKKLKTGD